MKTVMVHACNTSTPEAEVEVGRLGVQGQPELPVS
jgi:hypothetical protein